ncbi:hypothetical protein QC763_0094690 [Podospora pseudopauciseta]|uniref:Uncharacterized protein n=2 Tax=Podospora TaxID=5144 RepID=A0ABR0H4U7_9PEZI|nr:hypothetical protein QC763_0094690 [Podospora pseudopauciseta]KAK4671385.1 hypothetical protein QC764_0094700 [Podospora pseudoanserina]
MPPIIASHLTTVWLFSPENDKGEFMATSKAPEAKEQKPKALITFRLIQLLSARFRSLYPYPSTINARHWRVPPSRRLVKRDTGYNRSMSILAWASVILCEGIVTAGEEPDRLDMKNATTDQLLHSMYGLGHLVHARSP